MKRGSFSSYLIILILLGSIGFLDISRRYLSGEFESEKLELEFLYSSEKAGWLESVVEDFEQEWARNNSGSQINLIMTPIGSGKGTIQVANEASKPTVWSPASRFWLPILNLLWLTNHNNEVSDPKSPSLVVSPTIIATWESYQNENNIEGLQDIHDLAVNDPDFTFAHTDPFESNSGFGAVIMEAAVASNKNPEDLTLEDLSKPEVQKWMRELESSAIQYGSSTGFLGKLMASEGPSKLKAAIIYENLVIEKNKELADEKMVAVYPEEGTLLNDHPYAILDAPWVSDLDRELANDFVKFLLRVDTQKKAIDFGFRPSIDSNELMQTINQVFTPEAGIRSDLNGLKIYSVGEIRGEILERIPDLWSATRSRSLGSGGDEVLQLEYTDFIIPAILGIIIVFISFNQIIVSIRRYWR